MATPTPSTSPASRGSSSGRQLACSLTLANALVPPLAGKAISPRIPRPSPFALSDLRSPEVATPTLTPFEIATAPTVDID